MHKHESNGRLYAALINRVFSWLAATGPGRNKDTQPTDQTQLICIRSSFEGTQGTSIYTQIRRGDLSDLVLEGTQGTSIYTRNQYLDAGTQRRLIFAVIFAVAGCKLP
jgi:hypothetical protein